MKKEVMILAQAFYGNGTRTTIDTENVDRFILGYIDNTLPVTEKIDRTVVKLPNEDNLVIIYNKYQEEKYSHLKPLATIPELNLDIHSRCIACRMNELGEPESLENEDFEKINKYFIY